MAKAEYRSAIRSRKLIQKALADLLHEKPLGKITVTDVVRRAEINRGTFYAHYSDIPDVIHHLIEEIFSSIREQVLDAPIGPTDLSHAVLSHIQGILESDLDFFRKVMASSASVLIEQELVQLALDYLIQNEEKFSTQEHDQYLLTIHFCAGGLTSLYWEWLAGKIDLSLDELTRRAEVLLNHFIDTRSTPTQSPDHPLFLGHFTPVPHSDILNRT